MAHALNLGHAPRTPVCSAVWHAVEGGFHNGLDFRWFKPSGTGAFGSIFGQPGGSLLLESRPPQQYRRTSSMNFSSDVSVGEPLGCQQTNARSHSNALGSRLGTHPRFQLLSLLTAHRHGFGFSVHGFVVTKPRPNGKLLQLQNTGMVGHTGKRKEILD